MFSVIIPVYNGERFIEQALDSVLRQSYDKWEIVVVNDGSTDSTGKILHKYKDDSRFCIVTQENGGVSAARNAGIQAARYPYLAFLDADDTWYENHLEVLKDMIERYPDAGMYCTFPESRLVSGGVIHDSSFFVGKDETVYLEDFFGAYAEDPSAKTYNNDTTCVTSVAAKRVEGFPVGCKIGEDLEFSLKVAAYYPVVLSSKVTAIYEKRNSTATKDVSFDPDWHFFDEVQTLYDSPDIPDAKKENIRRVMTWFTIRRCRHYIIDGRKDKAHEAYRSIGETSRKKDKFLTAVLLYLPSDLVKWIFRLRWRHMA